MGRYCLIAGKDDVRDITFRRYRGLHRPAEGLFAHHLRVGGETWGFMSRGTSHRIEEWHAVSFYRQMTRRDGHDDAMSMEEAKAWRQAKLDQDMAYERGETFTHPGSLDSVYGFATRMAAATYIIKTFGYWKGN